MTKQSNTPDTLFLITAEGDRHEDHIPQSIWPLRKIKNHVTDEDYIRLVTATEWVTGINWFDPSCCKEEYRSTLEDIRTGKNKSEEDFNDFMGQIIFAMNLCPIHLDENNCCEFNQT